MKYKNKLKRLAYWQALFMVRFAQVTLTPEYMYEWWSTRLSLIKEGEI